MRVGCGVDTGGREASMGTRMEVGCPGLSEHSSEFQAIAYGLCHNSTLPLGLPKSQREHGNKRVWLSSNRHLFMDTKSLNFIQLSHATKYSFDFISLNI